MTTELSVRRGVALRLAALVLFAFGVLLGSRLLGKQKPAIIVPARASINGSSKIRIGWAGPALGPERPPSGLTMAEAKKFATDNSGNMIWVWLCLSELQITYSLLTDQLLERGA